MSLSRKIIAAVALTVLATSAASAPVFAHNGSHDEDEAHSSTTIVTSEDRTVTRTVSSDDTTADDTVKTEIKNRGKQQVDELRKKGQEKTKAARENSCNEHKKGAEQRISSISTNTARFQTKLDNIFTKAQAYVTDKNLTVENYDALVAAVKSAQTASASSIAALKALQPTIDCTQTTNAENVAAFRTAAQDARDKLKTYMKSVKDLLKAERDAKQAAQKQTTTSTETETEGSTN